ncbi:redoxin domain-containing protein [archaeon]|nr:MAG: redoxin domain-containing protein [archaeon]
MHHGAGRSRAAAGTCAAAAQRRAAPRLETPHVRTTPHSPLLGAARTCLQGEFDKRGVKLIALSCDSVEDHKAWVKDIKALRGVEVCTAPHHTLPLRSHART